MSSDVLHRNSGCRCVRRQVDDSNRRITAVWDWVGPRIRHRIRLRIGVRQWIGVRQIGAHRSLRLGSISKAVVGPKSDSASIRRGRAGLGKTELRLGVGYAAVEFVYPIDLEQLATQITVWSCPIRYPE